jgi:hypothetical protein
MFDDILECYRRPETTPDTSKRSSNQSNTNIAGEITAREGPKGFMLLQGIEPGIEEVLHNL